MSRRNCERINAVKIVKVYDHYGERTVNGYSLNKTLGRAQDSRANGAWLSKLTE